MVIKLNSTESVRKVRYIMAIKNILGVASTTEVKRVVSGDYIHLTANGITVKVLLRDWILNSINAKVAF